jgi:hypothetical protein
MTNYSTEGDGYATRSSPDGTKPLRSSIYLLESQLAELETWSSLAHAKK